MPYNGRGGCIRDQLFELSLLAENDVELNQFTPNCNVALWIANKLSLGVMGEARVALCDVYPLACIEVCVSDGLNDVDKH